jgi:hypothetical protein
VANPTSRPIARATMAAPAMATIFMCLFIIMWVASDNRLLKSSKIFPLLLPHPYPYSVGEKERRQIYRGINKLYSNLPPIYVLHTTFDDTDTHTTFAHVLCLNVSTYIHIRLRNIF